MFCRDMAVTGQAVCVTENPIGNSCDYYNKSFYISVKAR